MMTTWVMKWVQKEKLSVSRESFELGCGGRGTGAGGAGSVYLSCSCQFRCWCQTDWSPPLTELTGTQETCHLSPDPLRPDIRRGRAGHIWGGGGREQTAPTARVTHEWSWGLLTWSGLRRPWMTQNSDIVTPATIVNCLKSCVSSSGRHWHGTDGPSQPILNRSKRIEERS